MLFLGFRNLLEFKMKSIFFIIFVVFVSCDGKEKANNYRYIEFAEDVKKNFCLDDESFFVNIEYYKNTDEYINSVCLSKWENEKLQITVALMSSVFNIEKRSAELEKRKSNSLSSCKYGFNLLYGKIFGEIGKNEIYVFHANKFSLETAGKVTSSEIIFFIDKNGKKYKTDEVLLLEENCRETKKFFNE